MSVVPATRLALPSPTGGQRRSLLSGSAAERIVDIRSCVLATMERSTRRGIREDETRSVEHGAPYQAPWPPSRVTEGGQLRGDDRERAQMMSPDTTVASRAEAPLEERLLTVFQDGYHREQMDGRTTSAGDGNRSSNGSGNDGSGESVPVSPSPVRRGPRQRYKSDVVEQLESFFQLTPFPSREERERLSESTNLNQEKIKVWFQNRRARERRTLRLMGAPQDHLVFRNVAPSAKEDQSRAHQSTPASSTVTSSVGAPEYVDNNEKTSESKTVVDASISSSCSSSLRTPMPVLHRLPLATPFQPGHSQAVDPLAIKSLSGCFSNFEDYYRAYADQQSNPRHAFAVAPRMCLSTNPTSGSSWDGRSLRWSQRPSWHIPYRPYSTSAYGSGFSTGTAFTTSYRPISLPSDPGYGYGSCGIQVLPYQNYLHQQQFSSGNSKTELLDMGDRRGWKDKTVHLGSQEMESRLGHEAMPSQELGNRPGWKDDAIPSQEEIPIKEEADSGQCGLCDGVENGKAIPEDPSSGLWWCGQGVEPKPLQTSWTGPIPQSRKWEELNNDSNSGELLMNASEGRPIQNLLDMEQLGNRSADLMERVKHVRNISEMKPMHDASETGEVLIATAGTEQVHDMSLKEHFSPVEQTENAQKAERASNTDHICNALELEEIENVVKIKRMSDTSDVEHLQNSSVPRKTSIDLKQMQACSQQVLVYQVNRIGNASHLPNQFETNSKWSAQMAETRGQLGMSGVVQFQSGSCPVEQTRRSSQKVPHEWTLTLVQPNENCSRVQDPGSVSTVTQPETSSDAEYMQVNSNWNLTVTEPATKAVEHAGEFSRTDNVQSAPEVVDKMENMSRMDSNEQLFMERSIPWTRPSLSQSLGWNRVPQDEDLTKPVKPSIYPLTNYQQPSDDTNMRIRTEFFSNFQEERHPLLDPFWSNVTSRGSAEEWCRRQGASTDSSLGQNDTNDDAGHSRSLCFRGEVQFRELSPGGGTYLDPNVQVRSSFNCATGQSDWSAPSHVEGVTSASQGPRRSSSKLGVDKGEGIVP